LARTLFISDLHLSSERPGISELFFAFLRREAAKADALYILGDLFEYWIGDDELEAPDADPLSRSAVEALAALSASGVRLAIMHGNRDFLLGERFMRATGGVLLADPKRMELEGVPTLLLHGDTLCTDDLAYQRFRAEARSAAWQERMLSQSLAERRQLLATLREESEAVKRSTPMAIMDVNAGAVAEAFRRHDVQRMIHGHTHRPGRHAVQVNGRACERWVLPDWYETGGYLAVEPGGARLEGL
jgi:UDP-2,3-diacylglucosamine hydrolase